MADYEPEPSRYDGMLQQRVSPIQLVLRQKPASLPSLTTRLTLLFFCASDEPRFDRHRSASPRDDYREDRARSRSPNGRYEPRYVIDVVLFVTFANEYKLTQIFA